jgi:hypothetical protein
LIDKLQSFVETKLFQGNAPCVIFGELTVELVEIALLRPFLQEVFVTFLISFIPVAFHYVWMFTFFRPLKFIFCQLFLIIVSIINLRNVRISKITGLLHVDSLPRVFFQQILLSILLVFDFVLNRISKFFTKLTNFFIVCKDNMLISNLSCKITPSLNLIKLPSLSPVSNAVRSLAFLNDLLVHFPILRHF